MPIVHLMCGFIGFGKTTVAKQLERETGAVRFTPDEIMIARFGTDVGSDFNEKANDLLKDIWLEIERAIKSGHDVIYDEGCWSAGYRQYLTQKVHDLGARAIWHQVVCDMDIAKQRMLRRSAQYRELSIDENWFENNLNQYEPISDADGLDVIYHDSNNQA